MSSRLVNLFLSRQAGGIGGIGGLSSPVRRVVLAGWRFDILAGSHPWINQKGAPPKPASPPEPPTSTVLRATQTGVPRPAVRAIRATTGYERAY